MDKPKDLGRWADKMHKVHKAKKLLSSVAGSLNGKKIDCDCCDRWAFDDFAEGEVHQIVISAVAKCNKIIRRMHKEAKLDHDTDAFHALGISHENSHVKYHASHNEEIAYDD